MLRPLDGVVMAGKRVLVRADLNVPLDDAGVTDATRIRASALTIREILDAGGVPVVMSHLGRPRGAPVPELSMRRLLHALQIALDGHEVLLAPDCIGAGAAETVLEAARRGAVVLLENLRFHAGETANDPDFAAALAALGELYVNDAFSTCHRAHASVTGIADHLPAYAGRLLQHEVQRLGALLDPPRRPALAIIGGAKVDDKLPVIERLCERFDTIATGGGVANTLLHAAGFAIGRSLYDPAQLDSARRVRAGATAAGCTLLDPVDAIVAGALDRDAPAHTAPIESVPAEQRIVDIGPRSADRIIESAAGAATVVWAGPLGACDHGFGDATEAVARALARATEAGRIASVIGGGETVAALEALGLRDSFSHVSLAGGAFLEWLQDPRLPGLVPLLATTH